MARASINGIGIEYDLIGKSGGQPVALTPGGRFAMDAPGVPEMAEALAKAGKRVLLYDRPNCGKSDIALEGRTESEIQAEALAGLIRQLDLGPTVIAGGSGGSRVSLLMAASHPELCSHLVLWWISGGPIGLMQLATYYCGEAATLASQGGMEAVMKASSWAENFAKNPCARKAIRAMNPEAFIAIMQKWAAAYAPSDISPVPGMMPADFARLVMPTMVFRSSKSDLSHTEATSLWVHRLIPQSRLDAPPWRDDEWNYRCGAIMTGTEKGLFESWPKLVPVILEFIART